MNTTLKDFQAIEHVSAVGEVGSGPWLIFGEAIVEAPCEGEGAEAMPAKAVDEAIPRHRMVECGLSIRGVGMISCRYFWYSPSPI